jgi:predicted AAA+ superfamily ATPase
VEKDRLKQIILDGREGLPRRTYVRRDLSIDHAFLAKTRKVAAVVGPRRAGKSTYLVQAAAETGARPESIVFVDFSELPLRDFKADDFEGLYAAQAELWPHDPPVFFLDEIQEVSGFGSGLAYLMGRGAQAYIAGSSLGLLVRDLAATMRGKVLHHMLYPLSFAEYLRFRGAENLDYRSTDGAARLYHHLGSYEWWGGFPEVVLAEREDTRLNLIDSYVEIMLLRDVVERHNAKNLPALRRLLGRLLASYTREVSLNRWYNDLKSAGLRLSRDTVYQYVSHFEESLFFLFADNVHAGSTSRRKVFLVDTGLAAYERPRQPDTGKRFENHMFMWLTRLGQSPRYARAEGYEIDFVAGDRSIQVCAAPDAGNIARELAPLVRARQRDADAVLLVRDRRGLSLPPAAEGVRVLDVRDLLSNPRALLGGA